jgi:hypothetical protein
MARLLERLAPGQYAAAHGEAHRAAGEAMIDNVDALILEGDQ